MHNTYIYNCDFVLLSFKKQYDKLIWNVDSNQCELEKWIFIFWH
jgi:hypothetical protein